MKRTLLSIFLSFITIWLFAGNGYQVEYSQPKAGVHLLEFTLDGYGVSQVELQGQTYSRIEFEGKVVTQKKGFAELPYLNASVMIDPVKNVFIGIIPGEYEEFVLEYPLVPSRGVIYRDQDPASVPYTIDPKSVTDTWYPVVLAEHSDPFILRDIRGTSVYAYPFQYNPVKQVLRVYKTMKIRVVENNSAVINPLGKAPERIVREMDAVYRSVFINYNHNRDNLTIGEYGDIHVIVTSRDEDAIQPYVDWKKEKGYDVSVEVVPAGTVVNNNVQAAYDSNNEILYVLLVGDWADIQCTTSGSGRPMDPQVGTVVGTDDFADIAVGRFSANSPADVTVQVNKVIAYEKNPDMSGNWYGGAIGIASAEGAGIGDDGESDQAHETVIYNDKLDPFTYNTFTQIYDPGATAGMVTNAVNSGASVINYTGHGWGDGWGTTGFSSSNVAGLTNGDKLPFIVSVACNNGDFDLGTCFAESWLRKSGGGAIMFLGASISQPWAEPMRGQDYFMDILIGGYDYSAHPGQNGISTTEQRTTLGSVVFNGLTLMCVESGGGSDWETVKTWNYFGDPSVQARTAMPLQLTVSNTVVMVGIPFTTMVTTSQGPVANAMVTLSQDGLYFTGVTDDDGNVAIEQALNPGTAKLVITAFNTGTIYQDVTVTPPDGPFVTISSVEINDIQGNNNQLLDYGETVYLTISLTNLGTVGADDVSAVIATTDEFITLTDVEEDYGTIPAGEVVTITSGYELSALESLPDMHIALFNLEITGTAARETWSSSFVLPGHAPVLGMAGYTIDDASGNGNGRLDPGETALLQIGAVNDGSSGAFNVEGTLTCDNEFVTINGATVTYGDIDAGASVMQSFEVVISPDADAGTAAQFIFDLAGDMNITGQDDIIEYVGQIPVLLLDWDGNNNSADDMELCFANLEVGYDKMDVIPEERNLYTSIFVCLGTYDNNHVLSAEEGELLAEYLDNGGNLYMEGADTWYYDPQFTPTPLHAMFNILGVEDGADDLEQLIGQPGSIVEDMFFGYNGENSYMDHIDAIPPAQVMFMNEAPSYGTMVSYDGGTYRTVGSSFEFGGLVDGDMTKDDLMIRILDFFGVDGIWTGQDERAAGNISTGSYPNPFDQTTVLSFELTESGFVTVSVFDISGRNIINLFEGQATTGVTEIQWNGKDHTGKDVAPGIYFYRVDAGLSRSTGKMMKIR
ncbi:MAG: T9SS type A sorting domain-containing protein [Bacteroidales bacterium]|nr:T9SS type A sorting domain-containing protein [Bacteroidales bacterium]